MTLEEKQSLFAGRVASLIQKLLQNGYLVTLGEAWRPPEMAAIYAAEGKGIKESLHLHRLAIDLNLFLDGKFLTETEDYETAGKIWEAMSTPDAVCVWGGAFQDGNHFSVEHNGVR